MGKELLSPGGLFKELSDKLKNFPKDRKLRGSEMAAIDNVFNKAEKEAVKAEIKEEEKQEK